MAFSETQKFGVTMFPTDRAIQPVELAQAVEERGLDSLFFPEHTHIPAARQTPFPGGGDLPEMYWRTHDPFVALGAAAAATQRIQLGDRYLPCHRARCNHFSQGSRLIRCHL